MSWLTAMTAEDRAYIAKDLLDAWGVETEAQVVPCISTIPHSCYAAEPGDPGGRSDSAS